MTKRGLLLIDRGSREKEAKEELAALCTMIKQIRPSDFVDYCFLEVIPPFIDEGITNVHPIPGYRKYAPNSKFIQDHVLMRL